MLDTVIRSDEIYTITKFFCKGSLYAYRDTISGGYIPLGNGIRIGVCGSAVNENGKVSAVHNITSLAIRIPARSDDSALPLCRRLLDRAGRLRSCMIYAPSGVGKTTLLRSAAYIFARPPNPFRVAVVDTREEIGAFLGGSGLCIDLLCGYPKEVGIEIAARTLNAQLIVCDEVFGEKEAKALSGAVNCGVPILCSAHASTLSELVSRPGIDLLHKMQVFDEYVRVSRTEERFVFGFDFSCKEECDACI